MISTRFVGLVIDTIVCLTLVKWETVSGRFGGYLSHLKASRTCAQERKIRNYTRRPWLVCQGPLTVGRSGSGISQSDVRNPFLGFDFGCCNRLCRKLKHGCFLTFEQVS